MSLYSVNRIICISFAVFLLRFPFIKCNSNESICPLNYSIIWSSTYTHAPFLSSPLICDMDGDMSPDIVGSLVSGEVFSIHGESGYIMDYWPLHFNDVQFYSSPLLFDFNHDGLNEIVLFSECGKILFISHHGKFFADDTIQIPPLTFHRYWYLEDLDVIDTLLDEFSGYFLRKYRRSLKDTELPVIGIDPSNSSLVLIPPHIHSTPIVSHIQLGSNSKKFIILLSFYYDPSKYLKDIGSLGGLYLNDLPKYLINAVVILDPILQIFIQFKLLSVGTLDSFEPNLLLSTPVIFNFLRNADRSLVFTSASGSLYKLTVPSLKFSLGFPIMFVGSFSSTPIIYDINGDDILEVIIINDQSTVFCVNIHGNLLWEITLQGKLSNGGGLRMVRLVEGSGPVLVTATENGLLYAINSNDGTTLPNYPINTGVGLSSIPLLISLSSRFDPLWILISARGDIVIHSHSLHCSQIIQGDYSLISPLPMIYRNFVNTLPGLEILVSSESGSLSILSLLAPNDDDISSFLMFDIWESSLICQIQSVHRNISLTIVPTVISNRYFLFEDVFTSDSMALTYVIIDNTFPSSVSSLYLVEGFIGEIAVFSSFHSKQGTHSLTFDVPSKSMIATLSIYLSNEHGAFDCIQIPISLNITFTFLLKWILFLPIIGAFLILFLLNLDSAILLPK